MTTDGGAWLRLAQRVVEERAAHGWTQADVADRGGFSVDRLQEIERGQRTAYRPTTLGALERGLYWERGSVRRVLAGEEPTAVREGDGEADLSSQSGSVGAIVHGVADAIRDDPDLIDEAKQHLLNQYELLRRLSSPAGTKERLPAPAAGEPERPLRAVARKRPGGRP